MCELTDLKQEVFAVLHAWASQFSQHSLMFSDDVLKLLAADAVHINRTLSHEMCVHFLHFGMQMCNQLIPLSCDQDSLIAALLYPLSRTGDFSCMRSSEGALFLLQGLARIAPMDDLHFEKQYTKADRNSARHMMMALGGDIRIIIIKFAERLMTLMHLRQAHPIEQKKTARQVMALYAPLANRLGIGKLKWQLEDWSFRYLDPENFRKMKSELNERRQNREAYIEWVTHQLHALLHAATFQDYHVSGRAKHLYSIYKKSQEKELDFNRIYDFNAFRILVHTIEDCYRVLGLINANWDRVDSEFDDYIAKPKPNGYQSIHTIVRDRTEARYLEIQIRTFDMHRQAELGIAAHWKYKEGTTSPEHDAQKVHVLRDMVAFNQEDTATTELAFLFNDRIYVFTPRYDVLDLPCGATVLDAAYRIHTHIGHTCKGARVNQKIVPLTHVLKTGDLVDIITNPNSAPKQDWLNWERGYLKSKTAILKVKSWFAQKFHTEKLAKGSLLWEKISKQANWDKTALLKILNHWHLKHSEDLFLALASGHITSSSVSRLLRQEQVITQKRDPVTHHRVLTTTLSDMRLITQRAQCCCPFTNDEIIGYVTQGHGISIHKSNCPNIQKMKRVRPERLVPLEWDQVQGVDFSVNLRIEVRDTISLSQEIATCFGSEHIPYTVTHKDKNTPNVWMHVVAHIQNLTSLERVIRKMRNKRSIVSIHMDRKFFSSHSSSQPARKKNIHE